jgi:hypothetical protein
VINMSSAELANILDDMAARVRAGDSLEGSIEYQLAAGDADHLHDMRAAYRVGNCMGQGGMVLLGRAPELAGLWATIGELVKWLDDANGTGPHETAMRLMKLTEETGEAMQAYIGMVGQNPRKGITHTEADVADELSDVIVTAMVAMHQFTPDPEAHFNAKIQKIADRSLAHSTEQP